MLLRIMCEKVTSLMSVFQDESTGEITFYMKGADVVMAGIVQYNDWLEEEVTASLNGFFSPPFPPESLCYPLCVLFLSVETWPGKA